jgi:hypothetical protein
VAGVKSSENWKPYIEGEHARQSKLGNAVPFWNAFSGPISCDFSVDEALVR